MTAPEKPDSAVEETPRSTEPLDPKQLAIEAETSDLSALQRLSDWSKLPVLGLGHHNEQSSHDRGVDLGSEVTLVPTSAHGNRDLNNFVCKSADADLRNNALVPYHFDTPSCTESYVHGVVLARFEGSGCMTRFWLTSGSLVQDASFESEVLRVYADDNPRALVQVPLEQLLTGGAGEIFANPFGATSKSFIAWHYPVAFSTKLVVAVDHLSNDYYYQIDAVLDAQPQKRVVPRGRASLRDRAHALLENASPVPSGARSLHAESLMLTADETRDVMLTGPATIEELRLRVSKNQLPNLRGTTVSVRWDEHAQSDIEVGLLDLFASAAAPPERSSLALAAANDGDTRVLSLRLPMPFQSAARWSLHNTGTGPVEAQLEWLGEPSVPEAAFGRLSVQARTVAFPTDKLEQELASVTGRGRYVGVCADLGGHRDPAVGGISNFDMLQGDFRAQADGQRVLDTTGTEDYADNALFFRDSPRATPFAQNWAKVDSGSAQPPAQISFCRWQILGSEIDFQHDFQLTRELSQFDTSLVERQHSVVFLYRH
jgi:hypothetical protein